MILMSKVTEETKFLHLYANTMHVVLVFIIVACIWCLTVAAKEKEIIGRGGITKRDADARCSVPQPLAHGSFRPHPRRCPTGSMTHECQLVPDTLVPHNWVIYYTCDPNYQLNTASRVSLCKHGQWVPQLPSCIPALKIISKEEWGAADEEDFPTHTLPVQRVIIIHTATDTCSTKADCVISMQSTQRYHIQQYGAIGYNFVVGGDGSVLEGQGWDKLGAHTFNYNTRSVGVALVGNFGNTAPTEATLEAVQRLITTGLATNKLAADYKLYAHCQLVQIASPGKRVFDVIKQWPHWDSRNALQCL